LSIKRSLLIAAGVVPLSTLAAIIFLGGSSTPAPTMPLVGEVFTWNCESRVQKPSEIVLPCADAGIYVDQIQWSTWERAGAVGAGIFHVNDCDPDCADGTMHQAPVRVELRNFEKYKGKYYLRTLEITSKDGKNLPEQQSTSYTWDVMEFAEMMNWED
jgi:hypothetical protein